MGRDLINTMFNSGDNIVPNLMRRQTKFNNWLAKASEKTKFARPNFFTEYTKWMDWKEPLINFLRTQPGRNGVPLNCVIDDILKPIIRNNVQLLDDYVDSEPLMSKYFPTDSAEVYTYIFNFIIENGLLIIKAYLICHKVTEGCIIRHLNTTTKLLGQI